MCKMILNQELNGVELYFDKKPAQAIINDLKANGFRWSSFKSCWYAKQNSKTLAKAEELTGEKKQKQTPETKQKQKTKAKNNNIPLFERVQFTPGTADTSKYHWRFVGSNYTGLSVKETAAEIRKHLKSRFPEVKFSITSDHNHISIRIKESPYSNDKPENPELTAIQNYCQALLDSYNWDDSDSMTDYFNCHFYDNISIDWDYKQTEQTEQIKQDIADFRQKLEQQQKEEEERQEREFQEQLKQQEEEHKQYLLLLEEEKRQEEVINNSVIVKELEAEQQYFIVNSSFAKLNKNNTLAEYQEEVKAGEYNLETVKITREVHFTSEEALNYFSNMLLHDFDFLANSGGHYTDDPRINSITDYYNMDKEEQLTVTWNLYGVAIYCNNKLQFIVNTEGYNYARYIGLVDNATIIKNNPVNPLVNKEQLQQLKNQAETIVDISTSIITELGISDTWNNENWQEYKALMKEQLKNHNIRLNKAIIQQIDGELDALKVAMYKLLTETDSIQEQFKNADLKQGQKVTIFRISDFGMMTTNRVIIDKVENSTYAQYNNAVKVTFKPERKRTLYYTHYYSDLLVYDGWLELPEEVLYTVEQTGTGTIITKTKYLSCDKRQYDAIIEYFAEQGIKPIVNTYKPIF